MASLLVSLVRPAEQGLNSSLTAYTSFQPELKQQRAERTGEFVEKHPKNDKAISEAIMSDLNEAKQQVTGVEKGGFAWGIRQAIWGTKDEISGATPSAAVVQTDNATAKDETSGKTG